MKMVEHTVLMRGPAVRSTGASPSAVGAVLTRLESSSRGAVGVAFRRSSTAGRRQPWLTRAGQIELKDAQRTGREEMSLHFEAPRFGDVAQEFFSQPTLFGDGPRAQDTALDVLADAVNDVLAGQADSDRFDVGLLRRFHRYGAGVFDQRVTELLISGDRLAQDRPCRISEELPRRAQELYVRTPEPARARVAGKLDVIQASTLGFVLRLPAGQQVRGVWKGPDFETLRALVNSDVVATGTAIYRPSGRLLRIDADALAPQRPADRFFATLPTPGAVRMDLNSLVREQRRRGGMAAMWGKVPAEESDEDFLAAVAELD